MNVSVLKLTTDRFDEKWKLYHVQKLKDNTQNTHGHTKSIFNNLIKTLINIYESLGLGQNKLSKNKLKP